MDLVKLRQFRDITDDQMVLIAELLAERADELYERSADSAISGLAHDAIVSVAMARGHESAAGLIDWARRDHEKEEEE